MALLEPCFLQEVWFKQVPSGRVHLHSMGHTFEISHGQILHIVDWIFMSSI